MKTIPTPQFDILIPDHAGMCFGVKKAITAAEKLLSREPATILGQLAHNPTVQSRLARKGAKIGSLENLQAATKQVVITAHGASDRDRENWKASGYQVLDTTCPLVHLAHRKLAELVSQGYHPVIIGKSGHVEVRGLMGDFPGASVILNPKEISKLPVKEKFGVISQTTQPIDYVRSLVSEIQRQRSGVEVVFQDTVCQPTKDRQKALVELSKAADLILAIGGKNSNNTAQLARTARGLGCPAYHIESAGEIQPEWLHGVQKLGITAGTSTLDESMNQVIDSLLEGAFSSCAEEESLVSHG